MTEPDLPDLPAALIGQRLPQLQAIADALTLTSQVQAIVDGDGAYQYPQTLQYVCGVEHLNLAIAYLERAIGAVARSGRDERLEYSAGPTYGTGVNDVDSTRE